jgi:hypothetical protein
MDNSSKILLLQEKLKMTMRADVYRSRAKYYLSLLNHVQSINTEDGLSDSDSVSLTIHHFGHKELNDNFFIDVDLFTDLIKIQANRYWNKHDNCMSAVDKINKALSYE